MSQQTDQNPKPSAIALLPIAVFLILFIGVGAYFQHIGTKYAFYQLPSPVAILPALALALLLSKQRLNKAIDQMISGMGHNNIITMCLIYLLAGGFSVVAKATGGVDSVVGIGLSIIPSWFLVPGLFLVSAFIATAMGTSMGTISAVGPIAVGISQTAGIPAPLMAGAVISGAMFGDNLSIISDTTIAATRTQNCEMKDKFRENFWIALPAAIITFAVFWYLSGSAQAPVHEYSIWPAIPYLFILFLAIIGVNVFIVLSLGILMAGLFGIIGMDYAWLTFAKDIYKGFTSMQEIFILSLMIGGLSELMRRQGGLHYLQKLVTKLVSIFGTNKGTAQLGIAILVMLTNICTANNTIAILIAGSVAKEVADEHEITGRRSASILDIFACVIQGLIPYGAQVLLLGSLFGLSPLTISMMAIYPMTLGVVSLITLFLRHHQKPSCQLV
ncbi:Na+/H+ antiporter NhaC family protein [Celerinatantimonas diazotrophica]|uniref:Putative methionine transporter (NhaC family) n=1 Tax=Celerinatantimonas diazotrophica TaxID=412034 RepID=A0A4R1J851_9GAMM|nr:Na+/H+ antiporter NhaC family protein [Celerinatantimonas diazotrophica]TCK46550.1 putative methionine transporter (NhaC family) [Celerinatantimonas diazotrophica]CAG9296600.1 Malate-2H(+)/Na(+)-lactate antiporter [Celerinatantimonas diazotrophica]